MITNDATVIGLLALILGGVFFTNQSQHPFWKGFYKFVPALLLCYFLPSLLTTFNIIDAEHSRVYFVASRYLLPAALVLLCLSIDLPAIIALGPKALILFLTGTVGIMIGGPIALLIVAAISPDSIGGYSIDEVWRGLTTVAGSWIGGGANQTAMKEIFHVDEIFSAMITVDVVVANLWMAVLLLMAQNAKKIDARIGADSSAIDALKTKVETLEKQHSRNPSLADLILIIAVGLGVMGLAHLLADNIAPWFKEHYPAGEKYSLHSGFFWLIVVATIAGVGLSFTKVRRLEYAGASKVGSVFIYILVATIGTHMDVTKIKEVPIFFVIGIIWMAIHASLMLIMCRLLKAPVFYMAVGSQANVGGAASAPVVAAAFHPSLAPVGILLAVLGYAVGTFGAYICGLTMQVIAS